MNGKISTAVIGLSGAGGMEVVQQAQAIDPNTISNGLGLVGQIIILVVTLIGLFKKKKVTETEKI